MKQILAIKGVRNNSLTIITLLLIAILVFSIQTTANPAGIAVVENSTDAMLVAPPDDRTDPGGTITTMVMDVLQQNPRWKAYVGNISGSLTLDDSDGRSIFQWQMGAEDLTGNLFISRSDAVAWNDIECSNQSVINQEEAFLLFDSSSVDSINRTFSSTIHNEILIGFNTIPQNTCRSTSTFVDDEAQTQSSADFQIALLASGTDVVYTSPITSGTTSYRGDGDVDFQIIVPDQDSIDTTTYFFYAEIR